MSLRRSATILRRSATNLRLDTSYRMLCATSLTLGVFTLSGFILMSPANAQSPATAGGGTAPGANTAAPGAPAANTTATGAPATTTQATPASATPTPTPTLKNSSSTRAATPIPAATPADASKIPAVPKGLETQSSLPSKDGKDATPQTDKAIVQMQKQAVTLVKQKHYKEARDLYLQVLDRKEFLSGKMSKDLIGPLNDVVKTSCMAGACYDAMPQLQRLLDIKRAVYGKDYPELPVNLQLMGEACEKKGKYPEALNYFNQAVDAQKRIGGTKANLDLLFALNSGRVLEHMAQKPAAKKLYLNLLDQAKQRKLSEQDPVNQAIRARLKKVG